MKCANTVGIPFKEVGKRLEALNEELKKHGMLIRAESESRIEFGDSHKEVATGLTLEVCLFEHPIVDTSNSEELFPNGTGHPNYGGTLLT